MKLSLFPHYLDYIYLFHILQFFLGFLTNFQQFSVADEKLSSLL